jgi:hypothetical protein
MTEMILCVHPRYLWLQNSCPVFAVFFLTRTFSSMDFGDLTLLFRARFVFYGYLAVFVLVT